MSGPSDTKNLSQYLNVGVFSLFALFQAIVKKIVTFVQMAFIYALRTLIKIVSHVARRF